jgi:hypothetical protein
MMSLFVQLLQPPMLVQDLLATQSFSVSLLRNGMYNATVQPEEEKYFTKLEEIRESIFHARL